MGRKLIVPVLIAMLLLSWAAPAAAEGFDPGRSGAITITLADPADGCPVAGAAFEVYHIASVDINAEQKLNYTYLEPFRTCGIPLDDPDLPIRLSAFVQEHPVPAIRIVTDAHGTAACSGLPLGLYLVKQVGDAEGFAACTPFLVTVPIQSETGFAYDVDASPKTDVVRLVTITVRKVWNTDGFSELPDSVTVQLLRDGSVVETAVLSADNDWQAVFADLPRSDGYSIREVGIPKGYTATYTGHNWEFLVTNTPSLAQTGQLVWPIPVLAAAGLGFLLLGYLLLLKREGSDA